MMKTKNNFLLSFGSITTLVFGLLAAFIPGLAYVTVQSYFMDVPVALYGLPSVYYPPLEPGVHMNTIKLVISAIGGLIGLFSLLENQNKPAYMGFAAIAITNLGLMLPTGDARISFPEMRNFDVPWLGFYLVLVGVSIMFLGLAMKKPIVPRITLLSVPLLLAVYSIYPLFVLSNFLPWIVFGARIGSPVNWLMGSLILTGHLLMLWGAAKAIKPSLREHSKTKQRMTTE